MDDARTALRKLTKKKHVYFTRRGNEAIKIVLAHLKEKSVVFIQDQGGWLTYSQFIKRLKLTQVTLRTDFGLADNLDDQLAEFNHGVLLWNSMSGYATLDNAKNIAGVCKNRNITFVNDVSGSIGSGQEVYGDFMIGSFGVQKPIDLGEGGFIATDNELDMKDADIDLLSLSKKLHDLPKRLQMFSNARKKVLDDLKQYQVIHPTKQGINVIVLFTSESERIEIENYCKENNLEFTLCPRYIRVNQPAVSIEIKRL